MLSDAQPKKEVAPAAPAVPADPLDQVMEAGFNKVQQARARLGPQRGPQAPGLRQVGRLRFQEAAPAEPKEDDAVVVCGRDDSSDGDAKTEALSRAMLAKEQLRRLSLRRRLRLSRRLRLLVLFALAGLVASVASLCTALTSTTMAACWVSWYGIITP